MPNFPTGAKTSATVSHFLHPSGKFGTGAKISAYIAPVFAPIPLVLFLFLPCRAIENLCMPCRASDNCWPATGVFCHVHIYLYHASNNSCGVFSHVKKEYYWRIQSFRNVFSPSQSKPVVQALISLRETLIRISP